MKSLLSPTKGAEFHSHTPSTMKSSTRPAVPSTLESTSPTTYHGHVDKVCKKLTAPRHFYSITSEAALGRSKPNVLQHLSDLCWNMLLLHGLPIIIRHWKLEAVQSGLTRHVNATKSYLHFGRFTGDAVLCSNFFCFLLFLGVLICS